MVHLKRLNRFWRNFANGHALVWKISLRGFINFKKGYSAVESGNS